MINQPTPDLDFTELFDSLNETRTELLPQHFQKAARLSKSIPLLQQRWQVYLCALGVLGFEEWLRERTTDLEIETDSASIWQPAYANLCSAACNIRVGNFKICLLTASNFMNEHSVPFAVFDTPDFIANFYVLMQVKEEQNLVAFSGFINYEQFWNYQESEGLQINSDWTYSIPQTWLNSDANTLLLNLRCLDANAIQLPLATPVRENDVMVLQQRLTRLKSQLQTRHPWELLTISEGRTLLSNPDLINWLYKSATPSPLQPLINVGTWFNNQMDTVAQELGWMLMPLPAFSQLRSLQIRSLQEAFEQIRGSLEERGVDIPTTARGAFQDLESEAGTLRLYAITWVLSSTSENPEWMLLIALGSHPEGEIPRSFQLEVCDETQQLFLQSLQNTTQGILYAQVVGNWGEKFWVTVTIDDEFVFEIPPFGLELSEN
ncbi:MAG: DUF1822 family protein [Nostocaceae cyanobacterium]|nr:DUF1822 family protein [Nostocaceae cyanobacterium]